jgi:hypothetical protein
MVMAAFIVLGWAAFVGMTATPPVEPLEGATSNPSNISVETQEGAPGRATEDSSSTLAHAVEYAAVISAYSCDAHPANGMHPCGLFRDGSTPHAGLHGLVAAGPYEWLGETIHVEGFGSVTLVDTPRNAWYGDRPHIDLFLSYPAAVRWGIQERTVSR